MKKLGITLWVHLLILTYANAQSSLHINEKNFREQFLNTINSRRAQGCNCGTNYMQPAPPLIWNEQLAKAAAAHAKDMYKHHYFSHASADGKTLQDRLFKVGYTYKGYQQYAIAENIAYNQRSIDEVLNGWFTSKEHCKNLMNPAYNEIGIAEYQYYWVQDFGGRISFETK